MNFSLIILIMIHEYITLCGSSRQILTHQKKKKPKTSDRGDMSYDLRKGHEIKF